jgi:hypothetical protein
MQRRVWPFIPFPTLLSVIAVPLVGAAAAEGQDSLNALGMDGSSCSFGRARSRPAKTIKGAKKAAYYPKMRRSPQSLARRLVSPLFLPAASPYHEVLAVAQLDKASAAGAEADAARPDEIFCHAAPRLFLLRLLPPPHPPITSNSNLYKPKWHKSQCCALQGPLRPNLRV